VPRFTDQQLVAKALAALEAVRERALEAPVEPTAELRFVLAFLAARAPERWPFDACWHAATVARPGDTEAAAYGRHQSLLAAVNGIYLQLGLKRPD
jgi:hypothetical protein